jgi:hypothetical protein
LRVLSPIPHHGLPEILLMTRVRADPDRRQRRLQPRASLPVSLRFWARARRPDFSSSAKGFARFLPPVVRPSCFGSAVEAGDGAAEATLIMT